ncbi:MAG: NUDIX domain-containing protein [Propionibacteriaceae bacterium]|nr:NUDIX domain-containing protein [Propionibacteriaceae bacterium]
MSSTHPDTGARTAPVPSPRKAGGHRGGSVDPGGGGQAIEVSAVCLFDESGRVLTVRKRGTTKWMLVGGKPEPGETARQCALREVAEELGILLDGSLLRGLGTFTTTAANEGVPLTAHVFRTGQRVEPRVCAELEELRWVDPGDPGADQAPLNTDLVFPLLVAERQRRSRRG